MITTVIAVVCQLAAVPAPQGDAITEPKSCEEVVITDSERDPTIDLAACMHGQAAIARWFVAHPLYGGGRYALSGWVCTVGATPHVPKRSA